MRTTRAPGRFFVACLCLALVVASCGSESEAGPSPDNREFSGPSEADRGDGLVVALQGDADGFLPPVQQQAPHSAIMEMIMPGITDSTFENGRLGYAPRLAKSWEFSADGKQITFHLRDDAKWEDGEPITADDVLFTFGLIGSDEVASPRADFLANMDPDEPVTKISDHEVRVNFLWPYNKTTMLAHASSVETCPKHLLLDADLTALRKHPLHKVKPVGHGPFRLESWTPGQEIIIVPNADNTFTEPAYLKRIVFRIIREYQTRLQELENGTIDMIVKVEEKDLERVSKLEHLNIYRRGYRFMDYLAWNMKHPLFADREIRRALTMSINIKRIISTLLTFGGKVYGEQAYSTITPELADYRMEGIELLPYDTDAAKKTFEAAGWKDSDGDGWLDKDGKRFEFTLATNTGNPRRADAVVLIQQDLKKVGIRVIIDKREGVKFFDDLRKKDFEAAVAGWSAGLFVDPSDMWGTPTDKDPKPFNHCSYSNAEVDALIERGLRTQDLAEEKACWKRLQEIVYGDQPYTFLFWRAEHFAVHKRVRGVEPNILSVLYHMERWWVPKAEHKY